MKRLLKITLMLALAMYCLSACQPESDFPEIEEPTSLKPEILQGTWTLNSVVQIDQDAVDNNFPIEVQSTDITSLFPFTNVTLTFNLDGEGRPSDFTVNRPDDVPAFFIDSGTWDLDNPIFATQVQLSNGTIEENTLLTVSKITSNEFTFRVNRKDEDGTIFLRYDYTFTK